MEIVLGIVLILASVFLIVAVLLQSSKSHRLSGTIAGGAETFFGKEKGRRIDKHITRITTILGIVFVVLALLTFLVQPGSGYKGKYSSISFSQNAEQYVPTDAPDANT